MDIEIAAMALVLTALGLLAYTYVGYPVLLWVVSRVAAPLRITPIVPTEWPTVSVIISAYNEEGVIVRRIENLLKQDYPNECLQILIGSDGSTDGTCACTASFREKVLLLASLERRGKATVLNELVANATGEYIVFTDAATVFYPDAIRQLIAAFWRYPSAAVVGGELELRSSDSSRNLDGLYWRYEMFLKTFESKIGAGLGASGAIYAMRRGDYRPLPPDTMADDLLEPLLIRLRTNGDVVLHPLARAWQVTPQNVADEFNRRVRTGGGIFHVLLKTWPLLLPHRRKVALAYWSHKVFRLLGPWILFTAMVANLWLLNRQVFQALFLMQVAMYGLGLAAGPLRAIPVVGRAAATARYFLVLNVALAVGCLKFMFGRARPTWNRTQRIADETVIPPVWTKPEPPAAAVREHRPAA